MRTCPSTIIRRAVAVSNMRCVPIPRERLCGTVRQNARYAPTGRRDAVQPREHGRRGLDEPCPRSLTVVGPSAFLYRRGASTSAGRSGDAAQGHVAEWLRSGLQNRLPRFNSGRGLQQTARAR